MAQKNRPGRPEGSKTADRPVVHEIKAACPACGSNRRTRYRHSHAFDHAGTAPDGSTYTRIEYKRTECLDCLQHYIVRVYLNQPKTADRDRDEPAAA